MERSIKLTILIAILSAIASAGITWFVAEQYHKETDKSFQELQIDNEVLKKDNEVLKNSNETQNQQLNDLISSNNGLSLQLNDLTSKSVTIEIFQNMISSLTKTETTQTETTQRVNDYQELAFVAPDGIPSSTYTTEINKNQIGVLTCGPVEIYNIDFSGGADPDRGSVVILLPENNQKTTYTFTNLIPSENWFGIYNVNEVNPNNVDILTNRKINEMRLPPNGTSGNGCKIIDVVAFMGQNIYSAPRTLEY